jgi:2-haloacid dehalogenase
MEIKSIIFDLGNVLIYWNPKNLFDDNYFDSIEKRDFFLSNICTDAWNEQQDGGTPISVATREMVARYPEWEKAIRDYYGRWTEMLKGPIEGSVDILKKMKSSGRYKLYALTNWNACLFEIALARYDFLDWFDARLVSGEEKMRKPFAEFYQLLVDRYGVVPAESLFIDDNLRNVNAARELGYQVIHFKSPEQLKEELKMLRIYT